MTTRPVPLAATESNPTGQPAQPLERLYVVKFSRVGRSRSVPEMTANAANADALCAQVHRYVGKFLASSWYDVSVDLETGRGWIDGGRYGEFTVEDRGDFAQHPDDRG